MCWLQSHPSRWVTFIANRVSEILDTFPNLKWRHVKSSDNPADCSTRGFSVDQLSKSSLWWHGPQWLMLNPISDNYLNSQIEETCVETISLLVEANKSEKTVSNHLLSLLENDLSLIHI